MPVAFSELTRCKRGTIALISALTACMLAISLGVAVDFGRAHAARSHLQSAIDSAVLHAARKHILVEGDVNASVNDFFGVNKPQKHDIRIISVSGNRAGQGTFTGAVIAELHTTFMNIAGFEKLRIEVAAEAVQGSTNVELALVLDTTGSMAGAKLSSLKNSATDLVETLFNTAASPDKIKVGLVPFAQYVNVGMANRNAPWMNVPADYNVTTNSCWMDYPVISQSNCRMQNFTYLNDGVPVTYQGEVCDYEYGPPVERCQDSTATYTWRGCAGSRAHPLNTQDGGYGTRIPGILNAYCPAPILPLANDRDNIRSAIDAMAADGETYIPAGLVWGWRVLSNREPYAESANDPNTASGDVRKFLVLMSDGKNTKSPVYSDGSHTDSSEATANQLTAELCNNIKADGIEIFTIAFDIADMTIKNLLQDCASAGGGYYDVSNAGALADAFSDIGSGMVVSHLRR